MLNPGVRMSIIDDEPILDGGKQMTKFKVENGIRILEINVKNSDYPSGQIFKPFASFQEGEWIVNREKERLIPTRTFTKMQKRRFKRKKPSNKMKQALSLIGEVKGKGSNDVSSSEVIKALQKAFSLEEGSLVASFNKEQHIEEEGELNKVYQKDKEEELCVDLTDKMVHPIDSLSQLIDPVLD